MCAVSMATASSGPVPWSGRAWWSGSLPGLCVGTTIRHASEGCGQGRVTRGSGGSFVLRGVTGLRAVLGLLPHSSERPLCRCSDSLKQLALLPSCFANIKKDMLFSAFTPFLVEPHPCFLAATRWMASNSAHRGSGQIYALSGTGGRAQAGQSQSTPVRLPTGMTSSCGSSPWAT